jgi:MFS family permease
MTAPQSTASVAAVAFNNVAHCFNHLLMLLYPTAVLAMGPSFGVGYADLIELATPGLVLYGIAALPAGWLGDRWSQPGMIGIGYLGSGAGALIVGFADTTFEIGLGLALLGLFAAIYHPVGIAWLVATSKNTGRALGINGIFGSIGVAAGPLLAGALAELWGWRAAFLVPGVASIAAGLALALMIRGALAAAPPASRRSGVDDRRPETLRALIVLALCVLGTGFVYSAASVAMPKIFSERLGEWGTNAMGVGVVVSVVYVVTAFSQVVGGWLTDNFATKWVYVALQTVLAPLAALVALSAGAPAVFLVFLMLSCNVAGGPAENTLIARWSPDRWLSVVYGVKFVLTLGISGMLVPPAIAYFERTQGRMDGLLYLIGGSALAAAAVAALLLPSVRSAPPAAATQAAE